MSGAFINILWTGLLNTHPCFLFLCHKSDRSEEETKDEMNVDLFLSILEWQDCWLLFILPFSALHLTIVSY